MGLQHYTQDMSKIPLKYHKKVLFYTKYTHPTLICRGTHGRTDGRTKNITQYSGISSCSLGTTDYAVILTIRIKPSELALTQPLRKRLPVSDWAYPKIPLRRMGKRHHHSGDVCELVVFGSTVLSILFLPWLPTGREFFVPTKTLVKGSV